MSVPSLSCHNNKFGDTQGLWIRPWLASCLSLMSTQVQQPILHEPDVGGHKNRLMPHSLVNKQTLWVTIDIFFPSNVTASTVRLIFINVLCRKNIYRVTKLEIVKWCTINTLNATHGSFHKAVLLLKAYFLCVVKTKHKKKGFWKIALCARRENVYHK